MNFSAASSRSTCIMALPDVTAPRTEATSYGPNAYAIGGGSAGHDAAAVPATTLNVNVMEPVARPANNTRPLQPTLVENGVSVQLFDTNTNDVASMLPAGLLPTFSCRLSQVVIVTTT